MSDVGDEFDKAFVALYPRVRGLAFRLLGESDLADDVAAEAMARLFMHWDRVGGASYRDGWALRVAANLSLDHARRRRIDNRVSQSTAAAFVEAADDASEIVVLRAALVQALAVLPRRQREAIVLTYLVGLSPGEAARAMRVSSSSLSQLLRRGLGRLRTHVGDAPFLIPPSVRIEGSII